MIEQQIADRKSALSTELRAIALTPKEVRSVLERYGFFSIQFEGLTPEAMFYNLLHEGRNKEQNEWFHQRYEYAPIYYILRQVVI